MAVVPALVLSGCGEDSRLVERVGAGDDPATSTTTTEPDPVPPSERSSPFTVGPVPERYQLVAIGAGDTEGVWGWDCCGTDEPYVVLSPDGTPDHPARVIVAATGYSGYEGGLEQAAAGYTGEAEAVEVDGEDGFFTPAAANDGWSELVVARDVDLAIRVTSPDATLAELTTVLATVEDPAEQELAPTIPAPPPGLQVVGAAHVDAVIAQYPSVHVDQAPPGPVGAHSVGWLEGGAEGADSLLVETIPGVAGDPAALAAPGVDDEHLTAETVEVDGRPAVVVDRRSYEDEVRTVWLDSGWGDLVVVTALGRDLPTAEELVAIAASVRPTDTATWDRAVAARSVPTA
ncbi:hypothetical protein HC251_00395 [Iamia sp. SCSIO 61187]|nr:hypothetical protein HC251_00395 [Iamia sp. SCSIO 61187]